MNTYAVRERTLEIRFLANLTLVPTRANGQPAFGCYLPDAHTDIAHAYGLLVITLRGDNISAITWFADRSVMARFALPRTLPTETLRAAPLDDCS